MPQRSIVPPTRHQSASLADQTSSRAEPHEERDTSGGEVVYKDNTSSDKSKQLNGSAVDRDCPFPEIKGKITYSNNNSKGNSRQINGNFVGNLGSFLKSD